MRIAALILGILATALVAGVDVPKPAFAAGSTERLEPFVGGWAAHGFGLTVGEDGRAEAHWRVYAWCGPGVPAPCDRLSGDRIIAGGFASIRFLPPAAGGGDRFSAEGIVEGSTDERTLHPGAMSLQLREYGTAELQQDGLAVRILCGPRFAEAPDRFRQTYPCGA